MSFSRRSLLKSVATGFGYTAFAGLASRIAAAEKEGNNPLAPKSPHFQPSAKRVIFLSMRGGPSHVDTFDYKPALAKNHGKKSQGNRTLMQSPWKFKQQLTSET